MPLDERLALAIIEGTKEGLAEDLDEALQERTPLEIINGPLMDGMAEVGRQFNANQLIVAEVLQSAESMKYSVNHLEPHMERVESSLKGRVVLATVKGRRSRHWQEPGGNHPVQQRLRSHKSRHQESRPRNLIEAYRQHSP